MAEWIINKRNLIMKNWKICIAKDTSKPMFGLHGLHIAFCGLLNVEIAALFDSNRANAEGTMKKNRGKTSLFRLCRNAG